MDSAGHQRAFLVSGGRCYDGVYFVPGFEGLDGF